MTTVPHVTLSVFKACSGGYVGTGHVHPALVDAVREAVAEAKGAGGVLDGYVARCGDDLALVLLHETSVGAAPIEAIARDAFTRSGTVGWRLGQHLARSNGGPELDGLAVAFRPRQSEPLLCFLADKAGPGAWNLHLYRVFGDPFNTPSLLEDPVASHGFRFSVRDPQREDPVVYELPDDLHPFLASLARGCVVGRVESRASGEVAAVAGMGADPALVLRCHDGFPGVGEALEAFSFPYSVAGWLNGSHAGPLMPVSVTDEASTRFDGPPRAIGLGFQVAAGRLVGPRDLLGDRAFDEVRRQALLAADYVRRHGPLFPRPVASTPAPVPHT